MSFKNTDPVRNITIRESDYLLRKTIDGEQVYSETFKTLKEAMSVRDELENVNYEIDLI